ncbi:Pescadillo N-terminus-domain-containing protein [Terfezia claveryi]|nr:Pescadillo N-terminus-domain-containing protein [Terfezia claveryi]
MAKIKKKGTSGAAKNYLTRTQAVKKLQISLANFRRLCIFKGIYPREPRNRKKVSKSATHSTVFYYARDIQYLLHEPVLQKFRDHKIFAKKLKRHIGRGDYSSAKRLQALHEPQLSLDHIIKERYPTFTDALRDLDDALSMLHTFANLPSFNGIPPDTIAECDRLCHEWQHYIMRTQLLRKSFLSIKGIYYQAEVNGQDVLWLVPYKFAQNAPVDVDYRIMRTFVDFYQVLLGFVMFRLYTMEGLVYPPKFDVLADSKGAGLRAFSLETKGVKLLENEGTTNGTPAAIEGKDVSKQLKTLSEKIATISTTDTEETTTTILTTTTAEDVPATEPEFDSFPTALSAGDDLRQPDITSSSTTGIFSNCTFFLSRETPRSPLEFLLRSFGCRRIGWDAVLGDGFFTDNEKDPNITHQVVDRPPQQVPGGEVEVVRGGRVPGRIYVQPQYVWDCVNGGKLLRPDGYGPGEVLPPHLSPWVKRGGGYDPTAPLPEDEEDEGEENEEGEENKDEDEMIDGEKSEEAAKKKATATEESEDDENGYQGMTIDTANTEEEGEEEESEEESETEAKPAKNGKPKPKSTFPVVEEDEDDLSDRELAARQHQAEIEAEALGKPAPAPKTRKGKKTAAESKREREEAEEKEMAKIMMPRKKRKLYEKMVYGNKKREAEVKELQDKRRKIEKEKKGGKKAGKV